MDRKVKKELTFLDHLEELRRRIIVIIITLLLLTFITFLFKEQLLTIILKPIQNLDVKLQHLKVYDKFMALFKLSLYAAMVLSFPVFLYQISKFILPALYSKEKRWYFVGVTVITILFFTGSFLSYRVIAPISIEFLLHFGKDKETIVKKKNKLYTIKETIEILEYEIKLDIEQYREYINKDESLSCIVEKQNDLIEKMLQYINFITPRRLPPIASENSLSKIESNLSISEYIDWLLFFALIVGLFFQLPVIIFFLSLINVIDDRVLKKIRPYALVIILVIAAIIAPDVVTQIIIGIPFYTLYEIGILSAYFVRKNKEKKFNTNL